MTLNELRSYMAKAFAVTESQAEHISLQSTMRDVPEWTSLNHVSLILELETALGKTIDYADVSSLGSVQAILDYADRQEAGVS